MTRSTQTTSHLIPSFLSKAGAPIVILTALVTASGCSTQRISTASANDFANTSNRYAWETTRPPAAWLETQTQKVVRQSKCAVASPTRSQEASN